MHIRDPQALIILDGFGIAPASPYNAISSAHMPFLHALLPYASPVAASGNDVGLLSTMPGNSLVGHMTIGSGAIIQQPIIQLATMAQQNTLCQIPTLQSHLTSLKKTGGKLHLMGLLSDAGNHGDATIAHGLIYCAQERGITSIVIHPFLDGRDVPARSAGTYLQALEALLNPAKEQYIGSIHGRAYAMDRSHNPAMIDRSLQIFYHPTKGVQRDWRTIIHDAYERGHTDEYVEPTLLRSSATIEPNDGVIIWNVRADRSREITERLTRQANKGPAWVLTSTPYYDNSRAEHLIELPTAQTTILDTLATKGYHVSLCAESEKYAHITYFLNGGRALLTLNYLLIIVPSITPAQVHNYPCYGTEGLTELIITSLHTIPQEFYIINYGAADLLGHTGDLHATIRGLESLDRALETLHTEIVVKRRGSIYIVGDHGNAECMYEPRERRPHTGHTHNPVPFIELHPAGQKRFPPITTLSQIAPYITATL